MTEPLLTQAHIDQFKRDGWCVVENVVDPAGVAHLRRQLHRFVRDRVGFDASAIDARAVTSFKNSSAVSQGGRPL
jgi:ectoine hydroxylase-related dioxygenase (phytanoyl-CoA dioxygenase family)